MSVVDGERDADLLLGRPIVMEYDAANRGWRPVVEAEIDASVVINVSGTIDVNTELPDAVALSDAMANPTAPSVGAHLLVYDEGEVNPWVRARAGFPGQDGETPQEVDPAVATAAYLHAYDGTGSYNRLRHDADYNLDVAIGVDETLTRSPIFFTGSAAGEYMIATGVASQQLRVMEIMINSSNLQNIRLQSGWSGTVIAGPIHLANSGEGFYAGAPDSAELYHFETESDGMLVLNTDAGGQIGGWIIYYYE